MSSLRENAKKLTPGLGETLVRGVWPFAAILLAALLMQFGLKPALGDGGAFYTKLVLDCGIAITLAVSLTMVNGFTGQFSMGHAAFMAVGAYAAAGIMYYGSARVLGTENFADPGAHAGLISTMLSDRQGADGSGVPLVSGADLLFLGAVLVGGLAAAGCGYLVGLPSLRLRGDYLAIVTLGFGEIVRVLIQSQTTDSLYDVQEIKAKAWYELPKYLGGPVGFTGLPFYTSLFWVFLFCGLTVLVAYRLKESTFGRAFLSIREDEIAAEAMGVDTTRYKVRAFVISAFFAGVAGGLYAHTVGVQLNAGELGFVKSFDIIIMVVLGGLGSISGAAIAAVILTLLPEALRDVAQYRMVAYALALITIMILRPQGLLGVHEVWNREAWPWLRKKRK
ncbi:High-affinity branched-chain amino acid transport system permease protein LivH [Phycisphaerales bacterium]|nr:High-affinity branched-chain amino acid transport system permease protein LivH [Phycisphaerales bacterium]